jgi:hypothetical protein
MKGNVEMRAEYKEHDGVVEVPLWDFLRMAAVLKVWVHDYESYPEDHTEEGVHITAEKEMKLVLDRIEAWIRNHAVKDPGILKLWEKGLKVPPRGATDELEGGD